MYKQHVPQFQALCACRHEITSLYLTHTHTHTHTAGHYPACGAEGRTPPCKKECESGYSISFDKDKHYGQTAYSVSTNVAKIQTEIMTNGPVEGTFEVYADFLTYKSGESFFVLLPIKLIGGGATLVKSFCNWIWLLPACPV